MYNSQIMVNRIRVTAKEKGIGIVKLHEICGLSRNALSQAEKSQGGLTSKNLYTIAETLECSVDYLLGRTDTPNTKSIIKTGDINGDNSTNNNCFNIGTFSTSAVSEQQQEIIGMLAEMSPRERNKLMSIIYDYYDECKKGNE